MEVVWSSSTELEQLFIEITVNASLGVLVLQEEESEEPKLVFCSLFPDPQKVFEYPSDVRHLGITIAEVRAVLERIEKELVRRPFPKATENNSN